jgi:hypothetical protein
MFHTQTTVARTLPFLEGRTRPRESQALAVACMVTLPDWCA